MKYLPGADYFVYYEKLPPSVRGFVTPNDDGTFSIFLNSNIPDSRKFLTYLHEVNHIEQEDFYNGLPIELVENL